jgi:hypothetical protein
MSWASEPSKKIAGRGSGNAKKGCGTRAKTASICWSELIPYNLPLINERYKRMVMIGIGKVITASLASKSYYATDETDPLDDGSGLELELHALVTLIILISALVKMDYFDVAEQPHPSGAHTSKRKHAMTRSGLHFLLWNFLHLPLNMSLVLFGAVAEPLQVDHMFAPVTFRCMSLALATLVAILGGFDLLHGGGGIHMRRINKTRRVILRLVIVLSLMVTPFVARWEDYSPMILLLLLNLLMLADVAFALYSSQPRKKERNK